MFNLLVNDSLYCPKRYWGKVVIVHSYVVLCRIEVLESSGIDARIALSGMNVAKQLPNVLITAFEAEERIVVQIDALLAHLDMHLHSYMLESAHEALTDVLKVVVTHDEIYLAVQTVKKPGPLGSSAKAEVSQMKDDVILTDKFIPISYNSLIHFINVLEWTLAVAYNIGMVEVGV